MNGYIALKNTVLNGIDYAAGSLIPAEAVLPSRVPALLRNGIIAKADEAAPVSAISSENATKEVEGIELPIQTENGILGLPASREDIVKAVEVLQMKTDDLPAAVTEITSEDALIVIDACTKAQNVKKAIRNRKKEINPDKEGDQ